MRLLFFLLGMTGFIAAGMLHLPLIGVFGFVLAVVALFLASPREPSYHDAGSAGAHVPEMCLPSAMPRSISDDPVPAAPPRASRRLARHSAHHQTRHMLPAHALQQHHRAPQKEK